MKKKFSFVLMMVNLAFFVLVLSVQASDVNEGLESRIHKIYEKVGQSQVTKEDWETIAKDRLKENYQIQQGDTLWGISTTLFGTGDFWPKVWQLNDSITNPHQIYPGQALQFEFGNATEAPHIYMAKNATPAVTQAEASEMNPQPEAPTSDDTPEFSSTKMTKSKGVPALEEIPPSLGEWQYQKGKYDDFGFYFEKKAGITQKFSPVLYEFYEKPQEGIGEVVESETGTQAAGTFQSVFIKLKQGGVGDKLVAFQNMTAIENEKGEVGVPVQLQGEMKVVEILNAEKNIYRATVDYSLFPVRVGALLKLGSITRVDFSKEGRSNTKMVEIVGGEHDNHRTHMGLGSLVFIAGGQKDGLEAGDVMGVLRDQKSRNPLTLVANISTQIGLVKVVQVSEKVSTAIILESKEPVQPGDFTGQSVAISADVDPESAAIQLPVEDEKPKVVPPANQEEVSPVIPPEEGLDEELLQ